VSASSFDTPGCRWSLGIAGLECCNEVFSFTKKTGGINASGTGSVWEHRAIILGLAWFVVRLLLALTAP